MDIFITLQELSLILKKLISNNYLLGLWKFWSLFGDYIKIANLQKCSFGLQLIFIVIFTGVIGLIVGYINETKADVSIMAGWLIHAFANS